MPLKPMPLLEVQSAARVEIKDRPPSDLTPAQKRGLKYQAKVEARLEALYPGRVLLRPWFRYRVDWRRKTCQPDVIILGEDFQPAVIVEIKYSTIADAWHKLNTVYKPVVEKTYRPPVPVALSLVTRMFDPLVGFPCAVEQLEGLERLAEWSGEGLGVVSWK